MKFAGQIRYNYAHKERCFVEYDEFNLNRAENKLLKATLLYLYKNTGSSKNKNDIKKRKLPDNFQEYMHLLNDRDKKVITLRYIDKVTYSKIAEIYSTTYFTPL